MANQAYHHLKPLPRRFPGSIPVDSIGYMPRKRGWIHHQFNSFNFSFILSGGGEYRCNGQSWRIEAPCVITQAPGLRLDYGPAGAWSQWEELYIIYSKDKGPALERMGLVRPATPTWKIRDSAPIRQRLQEILHWHAHAGDSHLADRLDRLCELMIVESLLGEARSITDPDERAILAIRDSLRVTFRESHDLHAMAHQHGLSDSTFRRRWAEIVGPPPSRYIMQLRIEEACRLLVETRMKVGEIASSLGFSDPLYFSRRFRLEVGSTAAGYRRAHQAPFSLDEATLSSRTAR